MNKNLFIHPQTITKNMREKKNKHKSAIVWLTGLSGSGKSTIAYALEAYLFGKNYQSVVLDGDNVRLGINSALSFTQKDRSENIRRVSELAKLFSNLGHIVICSFVSPFQLDRDKARKTTSSETYFEIYIKCSIKTTESRDPKGLYKKAKGGEIDSFTGVTSPYEEPVSPDLIVDTELNNIEESVIMIIELLANNGIIRGKYD